MSTIGLRLVDGGSSVEVELDELTTAHRSEIEYQLMLAGATTTSRGLRLTAFAFRRTAPRLARLLRRTEAQVEWDPGVEGLLRTQLDEIRARRSAEITPSLAPEEVETAVRFTGRFTRDLTERQQQNLGRLLATTHGANFSVPGAGKTTTLLAAYEALRGRGVVDRLLVVAPKNAFVSWDDELAECYDAGSVPTLYRASGGRRGVAAGLASDPEIVLVTYQLLPNVIEIVKAWARRHNTHVTLDESHRTKAGYSVLYARPLLSG